jgi:NAD(P)-dependent dehydrogenase (short-subunit alcohol dehydrogenase family)
VSTFAITGCASGMGAATATRLRDEGHHVIGVDVRDADVVADLGTPDGRRFAIEEILDRCDGVLEGVVPFAGVGGATGRPSSLLVRVNYFGVVTVVEGLREALTAAGSAAAIIISSNSTVAVPRWSTELAELCLAGDEEGACALADEAQSVMAYPATKGALARWVRRTAPKPEWAGAGIRLNAIAPGVVETAMVAETRADPVLGPAIEAFTVPVGAPAQPEDVAGLVRFLLLDPAARYFCGAFLTYDGGTEALLRPNDWPTPWQI